MPLKGLFGSDLEKLRTEYRTFRWDGEEVLLVPAIKPDVCLVHAHRADPEGNIQTRGSSWDDTLAEAADRVIVTVEEIVPTEEIRRTPELTKIPSFVTTAVVEVPYGAHPTGCPFLYDFDEAHIKDYLELAKKGDFQVYLDEYVYGPQTHEEYLRRVGLTVPA
jgi:glutaconate CoA-transferase subunit A